MVGVSLTQVQQEEEKLAQVHGLAGKADSRGPGEKPPPSLITVQTASGSLANRVQDVCS